MSPKPRKKEHRGLPSRWRHKHGSYYFRVPPGLEDQWDGKKEFRLGSSLPEAYRTWAGRIEEPDKIRLMKQLFDRYELEVLPAKAPKTQESNRLSLRRLRAVFGEMLVTNVKPRHANSYVDKVTKKHGAHSANRDYEVLSHTLSKGVQWGAIDSHPTWKLIVKNELTPRDRYLTDDELLTALEVAGPILKAYITLKYITGLRRGDLLRLRMGNITEDGLYIKKLGKTGVGLVIEWTEELRAAIRDAIAVRPKKEPTDLIFCTRRGGCYVTPDGRADSFDSLWGRFMDKLQKQHPDLSRFQEKDIRKKTANDLELEEASKLLAHTSEETTQKHYRNKPKATSPHSMANVKRRKADQKGPTPEEILGLMKGGQ
jgi:integrase